MQLIQNTLYLRPPTLWHSLEYDGVAIAGAVVDPGDSVPLGVPRHGLPLHLQQYVLKIQ